MEVKTVVVADEDVEARDLIKMLLQRGNYKVVDDVDNGADAVAAVAAHRPNYVILASRMSYITGLRAASIIRACLPATKVVMCSADAPLKDAAIDAYVSKADIARIAAVLDGLVDSSEDVGQL